MRLEISEKISFLKLLLIFRIDVKIPLIKNNFFTIFNVRRKKRLWPNNVHLHISLYFPFFFHSLTREKGCKFDDRSNFRNLPVRKSVLK